MKLSPPPARLSVPRGAKTAADGLLLVDKPALVSSHDVVAMTRRLAATRKVGHAGTLDPAATGLLLLGVGRATRFLTYLVGADKTYTATVRLGQATLTDDAQGEVTAAPGCPAGHIGLPELDAALARLTGQISQVPCAVSAIKRDGVRAYKRVRDGQSVTLAPRRVTIYAFTRGSELVPTLAADGTPVTDLQVQVACSSGTYVRALARDLGQLLGCAGHLTALRRVRVGPFNVAEAATLEQLSALVSADCALPQPQGLPTMALGVAARRVFPSVQLSCQQARAVSYGQLLGAEVLANASYPPGADAKKSPVVAGFAPEGQLVALLTCAQRGTKPVLVLEPARAEKINLE